MASPPVKFEVLRPHHTGFTVSSLARAMAFWHETLGLPIIYQHTASGPIVSNLMGIKASSDGSVLDVSINVAMLQLPSGHRVELEEFSLPETTASADKIQKFRPRLCDPPAAHLAIEVRGMKALLETIKEQGLAGRALEGWKPISEPQAVSKGRYEGWSLCFIRGPDSEVLELMEPPEGS